MNCKQCGAVIPEGCGFCTQCGARVEKADAISGSAETLNKVQNEKEQKEQKEIKEKIEDKGTEKKVVPTDDKSEMRRRSVKSETLRRKREVTAESKFAKNVSGGFEGFVNWINLSLNYPFMTLEELKGCMKGKNVYIFSFITILVTALLSTLKMKIIEGKLEETLSNLENQLYVSDQFSRYGDMISTGIGAKYCLFNILYYILFFLIFSGLVILIYRTVMGKKIQWVDCLRMSTSPLLIATVSQIILIVIAFLSWMMMLWLNSIVIFLIGFITVSQFIKKIGRETIVIYTLPMIYALSISFSAFICFKLFV